MEHYIEVRHLSAVNLINLCLRKSWYTNGTDAEFNHLLDTLEDMKSQLTTKGIIEIAVDIKAHNDPEDNYSIAEIAYEINRVCDTVFMKI